MNKTDLDPRLKQYMIDIDKIPEKCQGCIHCYIGLTIGEDVLPEYQNCKTPLDIAYLNYDAGLGSGCSHEPDELCDWEYMSEEDIDTCPGYEKGEMSMWCPVWVQKTELRKLGLDKKKSKPQEPEDD